LEDYLARHPRYAGQTAPDTRLRLLTTGSPEVVSRIARVFWDDVPAFEGI